MGARVVKVVSPTLFWVHLTHCDTQFDELIEDLNDYMEKRKNKLIIAPHAVKEDMVVAVPTKRGWQRAIVYKFNEDDTVQLMLRDWGTYVRHSLYDLYILKNHFQELSWHAIPCGLAYAGPTTRGLLWSRMATTITKFLAENREGWIKIIKPIKNEGALIHLAIARKRDEFAQDLLQDLIKRGHATKTTTPAVVVFPTVNV